MGDVSDGPLDGFVVGITADRRASEQAELLRRRGADVLLGPAIATAYLASDDILRAATVAPIERPHMQQTQSSMTSSCNISTGSLAVTKRPTRDSVPGLRAAQRPVAVKPKARLIEGGAPERLAGLP